MHTFKDQSGTEWRIDLNVGVMEDIQARMNIDLLDPISEDTQLVSDLLPVSAKNIKLFYSLITILCEDQCKSMDGVDFKKVLSSSVLQDAYTAFFAEWHDFFLNLNRTDLVEVMKKMQETVKIVVAQGAETIRTTQIPIENGRINSEALQELIQKNIPSES